MSISRAKGLSPLAILYKTRLVNYKSYEQVHLRVFCGSQNKEWWFPYTTLTGWFSQPRRNVFTVWCKINITVQFRLILALKGSSIPSARRKLFILKRVQSAQLSSLQQSPPACRHALKLSRTWNDTVDFHPTTFIPGGLQKKKGTSFYFFSLILYKIIR